MNLGKYIHELLLENETVIIPGFGAFISVYKPAEIQGDVIKPPSKEISFTQQIRNNDGLLVGRVSNQEGISHLEAIKTIGKQRENLIYLLDKGERVILEKTGTLWFNANNEMEFEPFSDDNLLLDSYGLESISTKLMNQEEDAINEAEEMISDSEPEKQKKRSALWYLLILIPIVIAGIFVLMNERKSTKPEELKLQEKMVAVEKPPLAKPDVLLNDALENKIDRAEVLSDSIETSIPQTENKVGTGTAKFYLVSGGFKEEANAKEFVVALKDQGFDAFLLGKRGSFYLVAIGTYQSESEALRARKSITKNDTAKNLWILEE